MKKGEVLFQNLLKQGMRTLKKHSLLIVNEHFGKEHNATIKDLWIRRSLR